MILLYIPKHVIPSRFAISRLFWLCFLLTAVTACATLPKPPAETSRGEWGSVVIAPARFTPSTNFEAFAVGKIKGTAKGAAAGAGLGLAHAAAFAVAGGPFAVFIAPYVALISVPTFATGIGVAGGRSSVTAEEARAVNELIQKNLKELKIQTTLAGLVAEIARKDAGQILSTNEDVGPAVQDAKGDYSELSKSGLVTVIEIATTEVGFHADERNLNFFLVVRAQMIHPGNGEQLYGREFVYESDLYEGKRWAADNAALLEAELHRAYTSIAESIVEQIFLLTDLPLEGIYKNPSDQKTYFMGGDQACGLAWRLPPREYSPTVFSDLHNRNWNRFPVIATRTPTLEWEVFPRVIDQHARYSQLLNAVSNIRYDLRIWKVIRDYPPQLVYERRALPVPEHTLDQPLKSGTRYFWSVRARFDVSGKTRATRWSCYRSPMYNVSGTHIKPEASPATFMGLITFAGEFRDPCTLDFILTTHYYRFETP